MVKIVTKKFKKSKNFKIATIVLIIKAKYQKNKNKQNFCLTFKQMYVIIFLILIRGDNNMPRKKSLELGKREQDILTYIEKQIKENGYPPSVREIGKSVGLSSTATVHGYLTKLEQKGYIKKENQKGRALRLVKGSKNENKNEIKMQPETKNAYTNREMVDVPIVGKITAGEPILAVENITDTFPIPLDFVGNAESFMLVVSGESMINAGIFDGDYILVKKQNVARNGDIVVALIEDEATVKTFYKEKDHIRLQPENDSMNPIIVSNCEILGKVSGVFRKL